MKNLSEELSSHHNSAELIDHTCYYNGFCLLNTEEEGYVTSMHSINATYDISISIDFYDNFILKYYAPFFCQIITKMYLLDQNMIQQN